MRDWLKKPPETTAAKSFEHTKDPQPEGRGQRKDADVQTPAKRKAKTTKSSVSGFKRLRKLGGIPTTSGTPSKEYNEVEVRNEITEMMVDGNVQSVGISEPARKISSTDGEGIIGEGHSQVPMLNRDQIRVYRLIALILLHLIYQVSRIYQSDCGLFQFIFDSSDFIIIAFIQYLNLTWFWNWLPTGKEL